MFGFVNKEKNETCNTLRPATIAFYLFANIAFMALYLSLNRKSTTHSKDPESLDNSQKILKRMLVVPVLMIAVRY